MGSSAPELTPRLLRHDRWLVGGGLVVLVALSWWFLLRGAGMDDHMAMPGMAPPPFGALVLMWWVMMAAMMLPSASPAILLYARVRSQRRDSGMAQPWTFLAGYLLVWLGFSMAAALLQREIGSIGDPRWAGVLLVAAGIYQLTPLKQACLGQCRSPASFISRHWRAGPLGALRLGLLHGGFCLGCCWLLMLLLFAGGVMNYLWVIALTVLVAIEKLIPKGELLASIAGVAMLGWGILLIAGY
jgi:predicted metal-binding membrane protein